MTDDRYDDHDELDLMVCPECGAPAEVLDRFALGGTDGPLEHVKIRCLLRHWFLMPAAAVPTAPALREPRRTGPVR